MLDYLQLFAEDHPETSTDIIQEFRNSQSSPKKGIYLPGQDIGLLKVFWKFCFKGVYNIYQCMFSSMTWSQNDLDLCPKFFTN